jgi:hypothetical protein
VINYHWFRSTLIPESKQPDGKEHSRIAEQDAGFRQDTRDIRAAQPDIQHALHGPGGGQDLDDVLDRSREEV